MDPRARAISILATTRARPPTRSFRSSTSPAPPHEGQADELHPLLQGEVQVLQVLGRQARVPTGSPGMLIPFPLFRSPPGSPGSGPGPPRTPGRRAPGGRRPGGPGPPGAGPRPDRVGGGKLPAALRPLGNEDHLLPLHQRPPAPASRPTRILGPWRSARMATGRARVRAAFRTRRIISRCWAWGPVGHVDAGHVHSGPRGPAPPRRRRWPVPGCRRSSCGAWGRGSEWRRRVRSPVPGAVSRKLSGIGGGGKRGGRGPRTIVTPPFPRPLRTRTFRNFRRVPR
jgi:hypothetical protein